MTDDVLARRPAGHAIARPARPRHWRRWLVAVVVAVAGLVLAGTAIFVNDSSLPPLSLPGAGAAAPVGPLDGTWKVAQGSIAGFRIDQTVLGMTGEVVGRTGAVSGSIALANGAVTAGSFQVDLPSVAFKGKPVAQLQLSLDTRDHPDATITLEGPVTFGPGFVSGGTLNTMATALLTMRGMSRRVSVPVSARRDGTAVEVVGSIPVSFADWGIPQPDGFGPLGSIADHGTAEFYLVLERA